MHQLTEGAAMSTCPSCAEPLESGDLFCGACGYDLSTAPAAAQDHPTIAINGAVARAASSVEWPPAPEADSSDTPAPVHLPGDLAGTDSDGGELPPEAGDMRHTDPTTGTAAPRHTDPTTGAAEPQHPVPQHTAVPQHAVPDESAPQHAVPTESAPQHAVPDESAPQHAGPDEPTAQSGLSDFDDPPAPEGLADFDEPSTPSTPSRAAARPDPRTSAPTPTPPAGTKTGGKLCVACRAGQVDRDGYCENCGHAQPRERDHMEQELDAVAAVSDRGLRHHRNEDAFAVSATALPDGSPAVIAVVCDGVSSATRPDEASLAASQAANESLLAALPRGTHPQQAMHDAIVAASEAVNSLAADPGQAMEHDPHRHQNAPACTFVSSVVAGGLLVVGWVGDSRVYWVPVDRSAPAARLTEDDSWAAQMVAAGLMNEAEAYADERAHAITGWLGADAYELEPHTASFKPDRPGVVVVCTDGLWNYAEGAGEMAAAVPADAAQRPLHSAQVLVGHALDGGGHDNVTVAVLPFPVAPQGAGSA
ncbi:protein phosphatase 2C domain-containing protein [Streptomyces monticola]|uniref:Protein phosphatase 2C domain-containing protein n=1 Tax=Streptomyces monticola TaxID=2666263 RepID=A0ABW2JHE5_9ACTN